jgi:hypothetical protein
VTPCCTNIMFEVGATRGNVFDGEVDASNLKAHVTVPRSHNRTFGATKWVNRCNGDGRSRTELSGRIFAHSLRRNCADQIR